MRTFWRIFIGYFYSLGVREKICCYIDWRRPFSWREAPYTYRNPLAYISAYSLTVTYMRTFWRIFFIVLLDLVSLRCVTILNARDYDRSGDIFTLHLHFTFTLHLHITNLTNRKKCPPVGVTGHGLRPPVGFLCYDHI